MSMIKESASLVLFFFSKTIFILSNTKGLEEFHFISHRVYIVTGDTVWRSLIFILIVILKRLLSQFSYTYNTMVNGFRVYAINI